MFGETEYAVDVTVRGPKYRLSDRMFSSENLVVNADVSYVDSPGDKQLTLSVSTVDAGDDVKVVSWSRSYISAHFDTERQTEFTIEPQIVYAEGVIRRSSPSATSR